MGPLSSRRAGSLPTAQATAAQLRRELETLGDPAIAAHSRRFFKTGKGEYGEGDRFLGIRVPVLRRQARRYAAMSLRETRLGAHLDARSKRPL